ncbi:MAG: DUF5106 domain-containing protein [Muribaculaceae bacterium]|nr:DUF5106 domain-containing protein [Muribaculaceae bacterium]
MYTYVKQILLYVFVGLVCPVASGRQNMFPMIDMPGILSSSVDSVNYLAIHYWDRFDFNDNTLVGNTDVTERGFTDFLGIMTYVTMQEEAFGNMYDRAAANKKMLDYFIGLGEKYLYEYNSSLYDEELYILVLNKLLCMPEVEKAVKERLRYKLDTVMKNRIGNKATDFAFGYKDGKTGTLYSVEAEYLLVFFNDPACETCKFMKQELSASSLINDMLDSGSLKLLAVCVEGGIDEWKGQKLPDAWIDVCDTSMTVTDNELYYLPSLPVLYLLDGRHNVLLKNATLKGVEDYFYRE